MKLLEVKHRSAWRDWLADNHARESEVWLLFPRGDAVLKSMTYEDAVEEAICFGWVDSLVKRIDEHRYARKFTPRKPNSKWSTTNRRRYENLASAGLLADAGVRRPPTGRSGDAPKPDLSKVPGYIQDAISANVSASRSFARLPPSQRRLYVAWIDSAKKDDTRRRRLDEAIERLGAGKTLGLK